MNSNLPNGMITPPIGAPQTGVPNMNIPQPQQTMQQQAINPNSPDGFIQAPDPINVQGQILPADQQFVYQPGTENNQQMVQANPSLYESEMNKPNRVKEFILAPFYIFSNFFIVVSRDYELKKVYKLGIIHAFIGLILALLKKKPEISFCMVLGCVAFLVLYYYIVPDSEHTEALKLTARKLKVLRASNVMNWIRVKMLFLFKEVKPNNFDSEDYEEDEENNESGNDSDSEQDNSQEPKPQQPQSQQSQSQQPQQVQESNQTTNTSLPQTQIPIPPLPQQPLVAPPPLMMPQQTILQGSPVGAPQNLNPMMGMQQPPETNTDFEDQDDDAL